MRQASPDAHSEILSSRPPNRRGASGGTGVLPRARGVVKHASWNATYGECHSAPVRA